MSKHRVSSEMELSEEKRAFLRELDRVSRELQISNEKIYALIAKHYPHTPKPTFSDTICRFLPNLNAYVVIAFCKTFGVDIYTIYKDASEDNDFLNTSNVLPNINSNLPQGFYGTFYGYFLNNNPAYMSSGLIEPFVLRVSRTEISMEITHHSILKKLDNIAEPDTTILDGTIIFNDSSPYGIIAITFGSIASDCFITLVYNKFPTANTLHFRKGVFLTKNHGTPGIHHPVIQSFIFTDKKIDLTDGNKNSILQGALCLPTDFLLVKKDVLKKYKDSELLQSYQEETGLLDFDSPGHSVIRLHEDILRGILTKNDANLYQTFYQIKALSKNPKILEFPDTESSWHYISGLGDTK